MEVACGQCLGCRLDRNLMWAMRIVHEASMHVNQHGNCFVTFTYRDKWDATEKQYKKGHYVPDDYSLNYHHFRDFIKRLRSRFEQKIRYFHCGEYGDQTLRPHYHACLFNVTFDDMVVYKQEEGITTYSSEILTELWPYGFCTVGELNFETAAYTAGYILSKITGLQADEAYLRSDEYGVCLWVKPPYITMSLKPGIGEKFYTLYAGDFFPSDECPVPGMGIRSKVPRFYEKLLKRENPELLDLVKAQRQVFIGKHAEDFIPERLHDKYQCQKAKQKRKMRPL